MLAFRSLLLATLVFPLTHSIALATPPFFEKFADLYATKDFRPGYDGLVKETKCNICHLKGEPKKVRNDYGEALRQAGLKKDFAKPAQLKDPVVQKAIQDVFDKVAQQISPQGETFAQRIKKGKLP